VVARVVVLPSGVEIQVEDGEKLMAAAVRQGYRWPTVCGGQGTCRTCFVRVEAGAELCSPIGSLEKEGIDALREPADGVTRLACQVEIAADGVRVFKRGVRPRR
jgi:ferredoxin, 2Fe-2S